MKLRALSTRQAMTCERAWTSRCRCRCGGTLHGAMRAEDVVELAMLPEDDPHHVASLDFEQGRLCPGHPEEPGLAGSRMGETFYCDGSCLYGTEFRT